MKDLDCKNAKGREKPYKIADSHGLYLYVTPRGHRSWRWNYRFRGKSGTRTLGSYPELSLANARIARAELDKLRRAGIDPAQAQESHSGTEGELASATFETIARRWHEQQKHLWTLTHQRNVLDRLEREIFPHIGQLPLSEIKPVMVMKALEPIVERGAVDRAHRLRQFTSAIFKHAISLDLAEHDPAAKLKGALPPKKNGRRPALRTLEDAQALLRAVEAAPAHPLTKLISRMLALTAQRSGSLRHAEPHEFEGLDGDSPIWRIPAAKMKLSLEQKEQEAFEFVVPLSPQAVEIVKLARELAPGAKYVFSSARSPSKPMSENAISTMYRRIPQFSSRHVPHGWRATFATIMNERAQELDRPGDRAIIDLMLAHKPVGVEALYNRASFMPRRRKIAEEWSELLLDGLPPSASLLSGMRR